MCRGFLQDKRSACMQLAQCLKEVYLAGQQTLAITLADCAHAGYATEGHNTVIWSLSVCCD
jgi:hypothetical protein